MATTQTTQKSGSDPSRTKQRSGALRPCRHWDIPDGLSRDRLIETLSQYLPAIVNGENLSAEGQTWEDFLGEASIGLIHAVDSYDPSSGCTIQQWVRRRVRCHILDERRVYASKRRETGRYVEKNPIFERVMVADLKGTARSQDASGTEGDMALCQVIDLLPAMERIIIRMAFYKNMTDDEIAQSLGCTSYRVGYRRRKALKAMRSMMIETPDGFEIERAPSEPLAA